MVYHANKTKTNLPPVFSGILLPKKE